MIINFAKKFGKAQLFSNLAQRVVIGSCICILSLALIQCGPPKEEDRRSEADVIMSTDKGDVYMKFFDDVPKHKANFLKLSREGFFDGMAFHRVISAFMVQSGDPRSIDGATTTEDDAGYNLEAEINPKYLHLEGRIAAARMGDDINPKWESSSSQFYIVTGKTVNATMLDNAEEGIAYAIERRLAVTYQELKAKGEYQESFMDYLADRDHVSFTYTEDQRDAYIGKRGTPFLDMQYTIFGEVVWGMDIVHQIEVTPTNGAANGNVPIQPIRIKSIKVLGDT